MTGKTIKTIGICMLLFFSMLFINSGDVKAGTMSGVGFGKGYAQCTYTWDSGVVATYSSTGKDHYRLIFKVWGTNDNGINWFSWDRNFTRSTVITSTVDGQTTVMPDQNDTNTFVGKDDEIYGNFVNDKGRYSCPDFICQEHGNSNGNWNFPSEEEFSKGKCNNRWWRADLANQSISNEEVVNGDINSSSLQSEVLKEHPDAKVPSTSEDLENIVKWGNHGDSQDVSSYENQCDLIPPDIWSDIKIVLWIINVAGILLLVIMSAIEFIKAITGSEEDKIKKAFKNTIFRFVACVVLFLLPMIIDFVVNIVNDNNVQVDGSGAPVIGVDGDPLCKIDK